MNDLLSISDDETIILEDGIPVQETKSYGIGIDCHSKFIQVCVLTKRGLCFYAHQKEFGTAWDSLTAAKQWCIRVLREKSDPVPDTTLPIHYCIESTSTYHQPVLLAFGGTPSIVNPTLAGATKRKTDVLDAKLLATHDLIGVWRESYIPSPDINELRVLVWERDRCLSESTAASRRINNALVRFGYTIGRDGSVVMNSTVRGIVESILDGETDLPANLCPLGVPHDVREVIISEYQKYDHLRELAEYWRVKAEEKVLSMEWETGSGTLSGPEMLSLLMTAPQVGKLTAITWLVHIITPRRFPNAKARAAYCGLDPSLKISAKHVTSTRKRGGNKELHKALVSSADRLIRSHTEMFGRWGYNLYNQTGKWKKASNAVARKLAVALYYMMRTGQPFSYENYRLVKDLHVLEIPVSQLPSIEPDFKRYVRILQDNGIDTTSQLVTAYLSCSLGSCRGLGKKFFSVLRVFLNEQHRYKRIYDGLQKNTDNQTKEKTIHEQTITEQP
jgi:transposase